VLFSGCSSKQYFEPENITGDYNGNIKTLSSYVVDYNADGATLNNGRMASKLGISVTPEKDNYKFINYCDDAVLSTTENGSLLIQYKNKKQLLKFDNKIISATLKGNLLAIGFINNSILLYNTDTKKTIFKEYFKVSILNDIKITNPIFLSTVILYPTLNGKIVVVDIATKSLAKTINIDPKGEINNIIFLETNGDALIAATPNKIFSFINENVFVEDLDIKYVVVHKDDIFVATLSGEIIKFDQGLQIVDKKKFKFAKFHTLGYGSYLYALESQGYLIKIENDLSEVKIYDFSFDNEEKVITIGDTLYFEDKSIALK
jgi:hypothetical protein